ncbi:MAG: radical SAM protein [Gemmatimonadetes bacterium]|nr:radical SAM protein [Gemmatimonadota bacterium]
MRRFTDAEILAARPAREAVDPRRPYAFFVEQERTAAGRVEDVATVFLTNRECPYRCLMCDLWKHTTTEPVPLGAIPEQIDFALSQLPAARHVKLYNSGSFFDVKAVPAEDHRAIAERVRGFETVIVENHPHLCTEACARFRDLLGRELEIAVGLETVHPKVLAALNKRMTLADFDRGVDVLTRHGIAVRAFILLRPPFLDEEEGVVWAIRSIEHAFGVGVGCCSVIPTRAGNGIMERLEREASFHPPSLESLERAVEAGIRLGRGRVFADLWDAERHGGAVDGRPRGADATWCNRCGPPRIERLRRMNLTQAIPAAIQCDCGTAA